MKPIKQDGETTRLIDFRELKHLCGLSRSMVWRLEHEGKFPRRRLVTTNKVGWLLSEVLEWIAERAPVSEKVKPTHNLPVVAASVCHSTKLDGNDE